MHTESRLEKNSQSNISTVDAMPNEVGKSEEPEMSIREKIWQFLGIREIHLSLLGSILSEPDVNVSFFEREQLLHIGKMEAPFWVIDKAIIVDWKDEKGIITRSEVTEQECEGHYGMVPLIEIVKREAQTGVSLVILDQKDRFGIPDEAKVVPEVISEKGTDASMKEYIKAPATLIIEGKCFALPQSPEDRKYDIDFKTYRKNGNQVAVTRGMGYIVLSEKVHDRMIDRAVVQDAD